MVLLSSTLEENKQWEIPNAVGKLLGSLKASNFNPLGLVDADLIEYR
jgi:hypothetical protein